MLANSGSDPGFANIVSHNTHYEIVGNNLPVSVEDEIPFEIPANWAWERFKACCILYTGNSIPEHEKKAKYLVLSEGYDYIGTKDVSFDHIINYDNGVKIPLNTDFKIAYKSSVLMCIEGGSAGRKIGMLDRDVCFGNKLCMFNSDSILNKYIFYYLQSRTYRELFKKSMTGIIGGVSINGLKTILLPTPPLDEQRRIVAKIDQAFSILATIDSLQAQYTDNLASLKKSILQEAVMGKLVPQDPNDEPASVLLERIRAEKERLIAEGKIKRDKNESRIYKRGNSYYELQGKSEVCIDDEIPFEIPENWVWTRFGNVSIIVRGGSPRPIKQYLTTREGGINWIKIGDVEKGGKYIYSTHEKIIPEGEIKSRRVYPGDFLLTNSMSFGRPYISKIEGCIHDGWLLIHDLYGFDSDYLYYLLSSTYMYGQFTVKASGSTVENLNIDKVKAAIIPLPPLTEQRRIVSIIEKLLTKVSSL